MNAVSLVSLTAKASRGCGVFGCVGCFSVGFLVFAWFGLVSLLSLCFFACLRSFTDWCIAHRQQSREQKITIFTLLKSCGCCLSSGRGSAFLACLIFGKFEKEKKIYMTVCEEDPGYVSWCCKHLTESTAKSPALDWSKYIKVRDLTNGKRDNPYY